MVELHVYVAKEVSISSKYAHDSAFDTHWPIHETSLSNITQHQSQSRDTIPTNILNVFVHSSI
jgi:hypothetical protein